MIATLPDCRAACRVRSSGTPIQAYALDERTRGEDAEVIVVVGANYTQGIQICPRDRVQEGVSVEDRLGHCRAFLKRAIDAYRTDSVRWHAMGCASAPDLDPQQERFHLVMTNFCPWITTDRWLDIPLNDRADLLAASRDSTGSTPLGDWPHLSRLAAQLEQAMPMLWVAHGLNSEVFDCFASALGTLRPQGWLMTPNLSYPYCAYGKRWPRTPFPFR
jgi:hypothetical protein